MADGETYRLVIKAMPSRVPAANRLRRLLKAMLRAYGFKVVTITEDKA